LVGDASLLPMRSRAVRHVPPDPGVDGAGVPTDLYYANLYAGHAAEAGCEDPASIRPSFDFDSWDADGDGRFDEAHTRADAATYNPDRVDGCPDVAVGRLPAHTAEEVARYVEKEIRYESDPSAHADEIVRCAFFANPCGDVPEPCDRIIARGLTPSRLEQ